MQKAKSDPMRTKSGKTRLGPLNVPQLTKMLEAAQPKNRAKIQRRIDTLVTKYGHKPVVAEVDAEATQ
jgi:hypothetical protein